MVFLLPLRKKVSLHGRPECICPLTIVFVHVIQREKSIVVVELFSFFENLEEIGRGHFGTVYRAMFDGSTPVALKTFPSSSNETLEEFVHEVKMMKEFNQTNLLTILGITFLRSTSQLSLVTELMFNGSLLDYLRKHREEYLQSKSPRNIRHKLNRFARQIFLAMIYLEEKFIIHRDLAARNCLVDHHQQLKIADFGLSKSLRSSLLNDTLECSSTPLD